MTTYRFALAMALSASLTVPVFAQSTETTTETPQAEAPAASDTATEERADGLSTGQVASESEVGKTRVESVHGDWELRCIKAPEGQQDPCQLYQLLRDQNDNSVAEINLFSLPEDDNLAAGATIITPLETLLTRNVVVSVDGGEAKSYPFTFCTAVGCFARVGFTDADIASFRRGNAAKIVIIPAQAPKQTVDLTVSLTGFTDGFNAVTAAATP
ncbi:MAG: invasion associated locus B family protein [Litoreibacter sp.]